MDKNKTFQKINTLLSENNWQAMEKTCNDALAYFPNDPGFYYNRAISRAQLGQFQEARIDLEKALAISPNQKNIQLFLAQIKQKLESASPSPSRVWQQEENQASKLFKKNKPQEKNFGRYQIVKELGHGGMGAVYKAYDEQLNRHIALKVIIGKAGKKAVDRFLREAKATAQLKHPNIITVYDIGLEADAPYFTMDLIEGISLQEHLQKVPRDLHKIINIMIKVGHAIDYAHKQGIIHRDIKPANIMLDLKQEPVVMDFGLAKVADEQQLSKTGDAMGTPSYMSPEQALGKKVDKTTDVYALGACLYTILTGKPPFQGETYFNVIKQILHDEPIAPRILNPEIAAELEIITLKSIEKKSDKRYKSAKDWADDLDNFLNNRPINAKAITRYTKAKKWIIRHKTLSSFLLLLSLAILLLSLVTFWALSQKKEANRQWQRAEKGERDRIIQLARVALNQAQETSHKDWSLCGAYAAKAFAFLQKVKGAKKLTKECEHYIRLALINYGLLYEESFDPDLQIEKVAWHPGGTVIALVQKANSKKYIIKLWNTKTKKEIKKIYSNRILSITYSPDGKNLAALSIAKRRLAHIKIWATKNYKEINKISSRQKMKLIKYSPDSKTLASVSRNYLTLWNPKTGGKRKELLYPNISSIAYRANSKIIAFAASKTVKLWDIKADKIKSFKNHTARILFITYAPDYKALAATSIDKRVNIWAQNKDTYLSHQRRVSWIKYSPDGKTLVSASLSKIVRLWDVATGIELKKFVLSSYPKRVWYSLGGKFLTIATDHSLLYWDITQSKLIKEFAKHHGLINDVQCRPDGTILTVSDTSVHLWNIKTGKKIKNFSHPGKVKDIAYSKDGKLFASICENFRASGKFVRLWDIYSGKEIKKFPHPNSISIAYAPDNKTLASASLQQKAIAVWDIKIGKKTRYLEQDSVGKIAYSPNSKFLASVAGKNLILWDINSGKQHKKIPYKIHIRSIAYSPDGKTLASCSTSTKIQLLNIDNFSSKVFEYPDPITSIAYSPNSKVLAATYWGFLIVLRDAISNGIIEKFTGGEMFAKYGLDSKTFLTFGHTVKLWDVSYKQVYYPNEVSHIAYGPNKKSIAFIYHNKMVQLWNIKTLKPKIVKEIPKGWQVHLVKTNSKFNFRKDIPGLLIEIALKRKNKKIIEVLFQWEIQDNLAIKKIYIE